MASALAALSLCSTNPMMSQSPKARVPLDTREVKIEASASSGGATLIIASKRQDDGRTQADLAAYGKLLAERLTRGEIELLFEALPASVEMSKRLKEHPPAFVVSNDGGAIRVELVASNQLSRTAIHDYVGPVLRSTPKPARNHPGNNLGWDAPPPPDLGK